MGLSSFLSPSKAKLAEAQSQCTTMFQKANLSPLAAKMAVMPGQIPTRDMLLLTENPTEPEKEAIKRYEEASRGCRDLRAEMGVPTSASEDIVEARISQLRYGLYSGDIPYAVYNYGVARALKEKTQFALEGEEAYAKGREIGAQKRQQFLSDLRQIQIQSQLNSIQSQLDTYNTTAAMSQYGSWNCSAYRTSTDSLGYSNYSVNCY